MDRERRKGARKTKREDKAMISKHGKDEIE